MVDGIFKYIFWFSKHPCEEGILNPILQMRKLLWKNLNDFTWDSSGRAQTLNPGLFFDCFIFCVSSFYNELKTQEVVADLNRLSYNISEQSPSQN